MSTGEREAKIEASRMLKELASLDKETWMLIEHLNWEGVARLRELLAVPTPAPAEGGPYEARFCKGVPAGVCDYGVVSLSAGKEVCRVWEEDDARKIACLLNTHGALPTASLYRQVPDSWEASGVRYELVDLIGFEDHDALIEKAAVAAEAVDRIGREWVGNSLWANILKRAGDNVRKLKRGGGDGGA